jgi:NAD(P)H-nitrite reductase large subunit
MPYVVVGGGIAGSTVAQTLADHGVADDVVVCNAESHPLYSRMLLKEYAKDAIPEEVVKIHDEDWYDRKGIDFRADSRVVDTRDGAVVLDDGETIEYEKLFVTAGGEPRELFDEVRDAENVHGMWTLDQTEHIKDLIETGEMEKAVVVGGGFLGLELADALTVQGVTTHYLMRGYWSRHGLGYEGAQIIHDALSDHGVIIEDEQSIDEFVLEDGDCVAVKTTEKEIECDFVGLAVGVAPNVDYLDGTAAEVRDGVVVDEHLQSDDPDVYAAGDVAEYYDNYLEDYHRTATWLSAIEQGRVASRHALGDDSARFATVETHSLAAHDLDAPIVFLGDWDGGEDAIDRTYGDDRYRRITFEDDRPIGASLIGESGDIVGQLEQIIQEGPTLQNGDKERLLERRLDATPVVE